MTPSLPSSSAFLLPVSLKDLHQKTLLWESDLELWKKELSFFQKLIGQYGRQLHRRGDVEELKHFKMLLEYYDNQLVDSLSTKMVSHESRLKKLMKNGEPQNETKYRDEHRDLERRMKAFEEEVQCYKHELYLLIEKVLIRIKFRRNDFSTVND